MKFEVFQSTKDKKFFFRLRNNKGDIVMKSQGYSTKRTCMNGIESVRKNSQVAERFDAKVARNGKNFFNIVARNGQVVATSSRWDVKRSCSSNMTSVRKGAVKAKVEVVAK